MKTKSFFTLLVGLIFSTVGAVELAAQTDEVPKFEVGVHFTSITKPDFNNGSTEPGLGGRFTLNLNRSVALEAIGNFFPHSCRFCGQGPVAGDNSGNIAQGFVGVKAGKRFEKWGIFAKGRPGVVSFSQGDSTYIQTGPTGPFLFPFDFQQKRANNFAVDLGGILEFYPTKRLVTRFEAGDTLIHYASRQGNLLTFDPANGATVLFPFTTRSETRHNFQFSAGVGWRF
ncbi:MAG TPA: hypothetical protein VLL54_22180 [Pyrinomonadaceae bacterium]|nr:hypothetical protein [Pyrinomonadaceae bacterium]